MTRCIPIAPDKKEDNARAELIARRWPDGPRCVHCGSAKRYKTTRFEAMRCGECRKDYSVTTGTPMHGSKIPLSKWLRAEVLVREGKRGGTLAGLLDISRAAAWELHHRIMQNEGKIL